MKKTFYLFSAFAFALVSNAFGQKATIELTFTAEYYDQYVPLDSIYVENLTQGGDTMLYAPDTVLVIVYVGVTTNPASNESLRVLQNCPNPFAEQTTISIFLPEADHLQVNMINLLGQKVAFFENSLDAGYHAFVFYPGDDKYYILTATANGLTKAIKMVSLNNNLTKEVSLNYQGPDETVSEYKSNHEINVFGYSNGDQLRFIGFAKNPSDDNGSDVIEAIPVVNDDYVFEIVEGIPCYGTPTITYEGQVYNTVQIGSQCWFKENLNVGTIINGSSNQTNNGQIEKYCYANNAANCTIYGGLYQWYEMMHYTTVQGIQGICPAGWHLPTDAEWTTLSDFLGGQLIAGGKMKEADATHWIINIYDHMNESGFTALPGGKRDIMVYFDLLHYKAYFWSSTATNNFHAYLWTLYHTSPIFGNSGPDKANGYSVRCLKDFYASPLPTVTTAEVYIISQTTAIGGGEVTDDGGAEVIARGVCWSASQYPTIADNHSTDGTGVGLFVSNLTGLIPIVKYYVRAYATNSEGTAYGNEVSFIIPPQPCSGIPTVNYQGQTYNTMQIGDQCWFKENLNVGTMIQNYESMTDNGIIEKYCFGNDPLNCATYGGLYAWDEMMQYTTQQGTQGICPNGWHLPTNDEWAVLGYFLGDFVIAGGKMKETGFEHWFSPNTGATNESGFTALPGGHRGYTGYFGLGSNAHFWSSSEFNSFNAQYWVIYYDDDDIFSYYSGKSFGFSSRCVKD